MSPTSQNDQARADADPVKAAAETDPRLLAAADPGVGGDPALLSDQADAALRAALDRILGPGVVAILNDGGAQALEKLVEYEQTWQASIFTHVRQLLERIGGF